MIPTNLSMDRTLNILVLLLCIAAVRPHKKPIECPNCHLCPVDDQGCCFTEDKTQIANGESFNPNAEHMYDTHDNCANFTCVDGYFKKEFYCPLAFKPLGTACYHIGPHKLNIYEAEDHCNKFDSVLAQLDTSEKAVGLAKDIKTLVGELVNYDMQGVFWVGASQYEMGVQTWANGKPVTSNFVGPVVDGYYAAAYSKEGYHVDLHLRYKDGQSYAYPLCQKVHCKLPQTCHYEGGEYNIGEIIWKDPNCECSWIECGEDGQVKAITKTKPCCVYNGEVFGDGDTVFIDKCSKLVCKEGILTSYPYCGSDDFVPITYNGTSSCYTFVSEYKTYEDAVRFCASRDSKLAEITSEGENEAVENFLLSQGVHLRYQQDVQEVWLGGRAEVCDSGKLGHFHWTSAESRRLPVEAVYEDFCDNQPSKDSSSNYLFTSFTSERKENYFCWANSAGHKKKFVLCEKCASCEQIYKNVCYRNSPHQPKKQFFVNGEMILFGRNDPTDDNVGQTVPTCFIEYCENGKIVTRNFVCGE